MMFRLAWTDNGLLAQKTASDAMSGKGYEKTI